MRKHTEILDWFDTHLVNGEDYQFSDAGNIVGEYIWFRREEDLVAFRLVCGMKILFGIGLLLPKKPICWHLG